MKQRNNLDDIFKDKLKNYQAPPDDAVWNKIQESLNEKKKKRVIPIWWQIGGVAAVLLFTLLVFNPFKSSELIEEEQLRITSTKELDEVKTKVDDSLDNKDSILVIDYTSTNNTKHRTEDVPTVKQGEFTSKPYNNSSKKFTNLNPKTNGIVNQEEKQLSNAPLNASAKNPTVNAIVSNQDKSTPINLVEEKTNHNKITIKNSEQVLPSVDNANTNKTTTIVQIDKETSEDKLDKAEKDKKSIYDVLKEQEEKAITKTNLDKKWSIGPSIAPVYYNSLGEGSPIHSAFVSNTKSGNLNLSYGLTVSYSINKKLQLRSGIHKVDYGYDTNEVAFSPNARAFSVGQIENINYENTARSIVVTSSKNNVSAIKDNPEIASNEVAPLEGSMAQQMNYLEVPMELNYVLIDKKFGLNLIGGFSSLFLLDNAVSLESNNLVTAVGEANNVNDINFSTNIGIGLDYKISPALKFNLEPMFKYQLNTFENSAGNFKPYAVGVYSGLQFKF
ncbi:outer membrane beta-barrel protein [Croceivirga sp. JEA036]|uniref:outer membrane beta-barrel protein n=1 Tax=Croceivirga sp. JEA036 TaxID=2721162 RepID=UPI00143B6C9C|nr:outer membrane beta-barrel protein [Croceivirga sp. JEA036]NJB37125.1 outer membrane beta-barrel protein [Croceivirga sp. JEA036]